MICANNSKRQFNLPFFRILSTHLFSLYLIAVYAVGFDSSY